MMTLMEMLNQSANGQMMDQIARQYGLTHEQTLAAMEALVPAFSQGLKRTTADPYGMMNLLGTMASGQYANYFDNPAAAFGAGGIQDGNAILGQLFGSKEVSRAVADQAAQFTGLSQSVLKSLLPALAPIILGGLFKQLSGQMTGGAGGQARMPSGPGAGANPLGPLGEIFGQMMGGAGAGGSARGGAANPWGKMIEDMMGGGSGRSTTKPAPGNPSTGNPWGDLLGQMMGGGAGAPPSDNPLGQVFNDMLRNAQGSAGGQRGRAAPSAEDEPEAPGGTGGLGDLFGDMFETGQKTQREYQKNVDSIFDQFLKGMVR